MEAGAMREIKGIKQAFAGAPASSAIQKCPKSQGSWTVFQTKKQEAVGLKNCTSGTRT